VSATLTARMVAELTGDQGAGRLQEALSRRQCFVERCSEPDSARRTAALSGIPLGAIRG
jgi:hypothetical protein